MNRRDARRARQAARKRVEPRIEPQNTKFPFIATINGRRVLIEKTYYNS